MAEHELNKIVDDEGEVFNLRDSTKQPVADRVTSWGSTPSDTKYPSEKLVKTSLDAKANDSDAVHKTGTETVSGAKTFSNTSSVFSGKCASDINGVQLSSAYGVFRTELGSPTLEERGIIEETFANQLECLSKEKIVYETSPKGTETWTTLTVSDSTHNLLWGGNVTGSLSISKSVDFRITINAPFYCYLSFLYFYGYGNGASFHIKLERMLNSSGAWSVVSDTAETNIGWPGHNTIRHSNIPFSPTDSNKCGKVRLTFYIVSTGNVGSYPTYHIDKFRYYGGYPYKADPWIVKNGSSGVTNFPKGVTSGVAIPISSGGTGKTTAKAAEYNLTTGKSEISDTTSGDDRVVFELASPSESNGVTRGFRKLSTIWTWIKGLLSSESGVDISGNAATATTAAGYTSGGAIDTALQGKVDTAEGKGLSTNDFTDTYKSNVDSNTSARHTHSNKSVLDGISSGDITNWNGKQDDLGISSSGDAGKFLNQKGAWEAPSGEVLSITADGTTAYGFKIATTSTVSTANYPTVSVTAVVSIRQWISGTTIGSPWSFEGFLELFHRRNGSGGTESYFGRLYTTTPFDGSTDKGWIVFAVRNGTETIDWYIAPHEGSQSRSFQYVSLSFFTLSKYIGGRATCNIGLSLRTTGLSTYLDRWNSVKIAFLPCDASNVGSSTNPAYVDSNGQLKACKKLVQAVTSIDTSNMDPDVLYVM